MFNKEDLLHELNDLKRKSSSYFEVIKSKEGSNVLISCPNSAIHFKGEVLSPAEDNSAILGMSVQKLFDCNLILRTKFTLDDSSYKLVTEYLVDELGIKYFIELGLIYDQKYELELEINNDNSFIDKKFYLKILNLQKQYNINNILLCEYSKVTPISTVISNKYKIDAVSLKVDSNLFDSNYKFNKLVNDLDLWRL